MYNVTRVGFYTSLTYKINQPKLILQVLEPQKKKKKKWTCTLFILFVTISF